MKTAILPPSSFLLKAVDDRKGQIEGYASLYGLEDQDGDVVAPGAFDASLREWGKSGRTPSLLWQHDATQPIGLWQVLKSDGSGLFVKGQLFIHEVAKAAEAYALLRRGALSGLSIGYRPVKVRRDAKRGLRILEEIKLYEISLVTFPALDAARVSGVKQQATPGLAAEPALITALQRCAATLWALTPALPPKDRRS